MARKDDCRDKMLIAMARGIEALLDQQRHRAESIVAANEIARIEGELQGCREIFEKA